jgi:hypothetical protein
LARPFCISAKEGDTDGRPATTNPFVAGSTPCFLSTTPGEGEPSGEDIIPNEEEKRGSKDSMLLLRRGGPREEQVLLSLARL